MNLTKVFGSLALILVAAGAFAQDARPTKAQTTAYIQANYRTAIKYIASSETDTATVYSLETLEGDFSEIKIAFVGTRLNVTYHDVLRRSLIGAVTTAEGGVRLNDDKEIKNVVVSITFDLKDIESIEGITDSHVHTIAYGEGKSGNIFPIYLWFKAADGKPAIEYTVDGGEVKQASAIFVPYSNDAVDDNHQALRDLKDEQLYKAFEHLRKLSGAPEPVRF